MNEYCTECHHPRVDHRNSGGCVHYTSPPVDKYCLCQLSASEVDHQQTQDTAIRDLRARLADAERIAEQLANDIESLEYHMGRYSPNTNCPTCKAIAQHLADYAAFVKEQEK